MKHYWLSRRYRKPADDNSGGSGVDRGDDFTPTDEDPAAAKAAAEAADAAKAAAALAAETAAAEAAAAKKAGKPAEGEGDEGDDAGKDTKPKKDTRIPLSRHEALLNKEREANAALVARIAQYEKGAQVADLNADLTKAEEKAVALEKDYAKLVADGEVEKAAAVMNQIRALDRQMAESRNGMKIAAAVALATETARFNIALERVEEAYPRLNPEHEDYDAELDSDVADLKVTYERRGMTPTAALQKAVAKLAGTASPKQDAATTVTPRVDSKTVAKDVAAERKEAAVAKTLAAVKATPPNTSKVGLDSDSQGGQITAKDVMKMSHKDFSALTEEQLSAMRGDVI